MKMHNHNYQLFWRMHFANSREFTCFCSEASGIAFKQMLQQNATKHQARAMAELVEHFHGTDGAFPRILLCSSHIHGSS